MKKGIKFFCTTAVAVLLILTTALSFPATAKAAKKTKKSTDLPMTMTLVQNDGTLVQVKNGSTVPYSKLVNSYFVVSGLSGSETYDYVQICTENALDVGGAIESFYAYDGVVTKSTNKNMIKKCTYNLIFEGTPIITNYQYLIDTTDYGTPEAPYLRNVICFYFVQLDKNVKEIPNKEWVLNINVDFTK